MPHKLCSVVGKNVTLQDQYVNKSASEVEAYKTVSKEETA